MQRPEPSEHREYYGLYIGKVPEGNIISILDEQLAQTLDILGNVSPERADYAYEPGKWTIKEVIGHLIDTERVFAYRALHFARNDPAPLPSLEQDDWASASNASARSLEDLLEDFAAVRKSNIALFKSFSDEMWMRRGTASGFEFTVRAFPYIIAGHEIHHRLLLQERYLQ